MGRFWNGALAKVLGLTLAILIVGLGACSLPEKPGPTSFIDVTGELGRKGLAGLAALDYLGLPRESTVAEMAELRATEFVEVEGYGLVIGLVDKGSPAPPEPMRQALRNKLIGLGYDAEIASLMMESLDTARVRVWGRIPPAVTEGSSFDCFVEADSPSVDLTGGYLLKTDFAWGIEEAGRYMETKATAEGPVGAGGFDYEAVRSGGGNLHQGVILGGGTVSDTRILYFRLKKEDPNSAVGLSLLINSRFPRRAAAVSNQEILLGVPPEYLDDWKHFIEVVDKRAPWMLDEENLYRRLDEICQAFVNAEGDEVEEIGLFLEAIGPPAADHLRAALNCPNREVRYQAAKALAYGKDQSANEVLFEFASSASPARRVQATRLLGKVGDVSSIPLLARLLESNSYQVRWEAMQALEALDKDETYIWISKMRDFRLLGVHGDTEEVILINQKGLPKIMLFGENMKITPPATAAARMVNLLFEEDGATFYFWRGSERKKYKLESLKVKDTVEFLVVNLGLSFFDIGRVLEDLSKAGALKAQVVFI